VQGELLFNANWTDQQGGGRPSTKGTGRPLAEPSKALTGARFSNRISAPDANSCASCHNAPYGIVGGGGDFVTGVFVLGQRFDFMTFDRKDTLPLRGAVDEGGKPASLQDAGDYRATTGMFGAGYLEMLARQMTADLQRTRDSIRRGETKELVAKGVSFGTLTLKQDGLWDTTKVTGLGRLSVVSGGTVSPPTLIIRPWHQASNVVSLREFTNTAFNQHHGIQSTERFGIDTDPDGDGVKNEMTRADVTAVTMFQATLQVPGRVIPRDPVVERAVLKGEKLFDQAGCATCHIPRLPLDKQGWVFVEPNPYNPPGNLRTGEVPDLKLDLSADTLPQPRLKPDASGVAWVDAYTDFKLHDICAPEDPREPLDQNQAQWSPKIREGNCRFLTKRLWGAANEPPFFHHGLFTTLRQSVLAHAGEAEESRRAFQALPAGDRDALIEFLKTLQVLPPGTKDRIVDEKFHARTWPPAVETTNTGQAQAGHYRSLAGAIRFNDRRRRVAANGAAPSGAEALSVTGALRRAPDGAVGGQDPTAGVTTRMKLVVNHRQGNRQRFSRSSRSLSRLRSRQPRLSCRSMMQRWRRWRSSCTPISNAPSARSSRSRSASCRPRASTA
jgi:cytochrome c peroxidase